MQQLVKFKFPLLRLVVDYAPGFILRHTHRHRLLFDKKQFWRLNNQHFKKVFELIELIKREREGDKTYLVCLVDADVFGGEIRGGSGSNDHFNLLLLYHSSSIFFA